MLDTITDNVVYAVERDDRTVYCASPACVQALLATGWRLSDPRQLTSLVRRLSSGDYRATHDPEDHFR